MSRSQNLYFRNCRKHSFSANLNQFWLSFKEDDKEINNMVIEDNVSTINSKTKMDQEFKSEGQGQDHLISIFKNEEKRGCLAYLNQYWYVL